jgi:hypothetical protein
VGWTGETEITSVTQVGIAVCGSSRMMLLGSLATTCLYAFDCKDFCICGKCCQHSSGMGGTGAAETTSVAQVWVYAFSALQAAN